MVINAPGIDTPGIELLNGSDVLFVSLEVT